MLVIVRPRNRLSVSRVAPHAMVVRRRPRQQEGQRVHVAASHLTPPRRARAHRRRPRAIAGPNPCIEAPPILSPCAHRRYDSLVERRGFELPVPLPRYRLFLGEEIRPEVDRCISKDAVPFHGDQRFDIPRSENLCRPCLCRRAARRGPADETLGIDSRQGVRRAGRA